MRERKRLKSQSPSESPAASRGHVPFEGDTSASEFPSLRAQLRALAVRLQSNPTFSRQELNRHRASAAVKRKWTKAPGWWSLVPKRTPSER
jgi:hypothetical protein